VSGKYDEAKLVLRFLVVFTVILIPNAFSLDWKSKDASHGVLNEFYEGEDIFYRITVRYESRCEKHGIPFVRYKV